MADPKFIFWPYGSGTRTFVDMGEPISDLQITPTRRVADSKALSGRVVRTNLTSGLNVRIVDERFTSREKFRQLSRLINHLEQGYACAFARDPDNAYGHQVRTAVRNSSSVRIEAPNYFHDWTSTGGSHLFPAVDDEVVLETGPWRGVREYFRVTSVSVSTGYLDIGLDHRIRGIYDNAAILRHSDFWPVLRLPAGAVGSPSLLTHDHRISYTLDLPLEFQSDAIEVAAQDIQPAGPNMSVTEGQEYGDTVKTTLDAWLATGGEDRLKERVSVIVPIAPIEGID